MSQDGLQKQQQLVSALLSPSCYPHPTKKIQVIETHISWVLLAGRFAYKIKKALDLGFLNTLSLDARLTDCQEELRLNRRLAPQLYLEVVAIGGDHAEPKLGVQPAIEFAVKMRRFAAKNTFDRLVSRNKINTSQMNVLAHTLADFHASLPAAIGSSEHFSQTVLTSLQQSFSQLSTLTTHHPALDLLREKSLQHIDYIEKLLFFRHSKGFVRECHGDLHLGNIALIRNKPTPFDGIDFNPALRWIDVMDEVAFLFMDLLHQQQSALAYHFLNTYLELSGDYAGVALLNFYSSYRALVRAKVASIHASQFSNPATKRKKLLNNAQRYLLLAQQLTALRNPALIITHGLPGSGKSMFAQVALEQLGAIRIRSDVERKRLFGLSALANSQICNNIYSAEATARTYSFLLKTARELLTAGQTVIVDAAFLKLGERQMFNDLANTMQLPFAIVSLQSDEAILCSRILKRQALGNDASEAGIDVMKKLAAIKEPISQSEIDFTLVYVNTHDGIIEPSVWAALEHILSRQK
ncbi:MAG: AAA family ATPase [Gallionellaceae bacterium]|nr:AAA family ATPase [Gallionellaceae bacterium]